MKTKLIILMAAAAVILYSCSGDRDETIAPTPEKTSKQENLKLNPIIQNSESTDFEVKSDTIRILNSGDVNELPDDGGDPKDVPVPPRR